MRSNARPRTSTMATPASRVRWCSSSSICTASPLAAIAILNIFLTRLWLSAFIFFVQRVTTCPPGHLPRTNQLPQMGTGIRGSLGKRQGMCLSIGVIPCLQHSAECIIGIQRPATTITNIKIQFGKYLYTGISYSVYCGGSGLKKSPRSQQRMECTPNSRLNVCMTKS